MNLAGIVNPDYCVFGQLISYRTIAGVQAAADTSRWAAGSSGSCSDVKVSFLVACHAGSVSNRALGSPQRRPPTTKMSLRRSALWTASITATE